MQKEKSEASNARVILLVNVLRRKMTLCFQGEVLGNAG